MKISKNSKNSIWLKAALFNLTASLLLAIMSSVLVAKAFAQAGPTGPTPPPPPPYTPRISVTPAIAPVGVERTISVSGVWPTACIPVGLTALREASAFTRALPLRLEIPLTSVACAQVITPYEFKITFTPTRSGDYRLVAYANDDVSTNELLMAVQSLDSSRSLYNLTGMWYDLATSGSGIVFVHSYTTSDSVFGAWFMYDQQGNARWYSAQEGRWRNDTEWNGVLYETAAAPLSCAANLSACPLPFRSLRRAGTARVTMSGRDDVTLEAIGSDGKVMFTSKLIKGL